MKWFKSLAILLCGAAMPAHADGYELAMRAFLESDISAWAQSEPIITAINAQNARTAGYGQARIDELDALWAAEIGSSNAPTITAVLQNPAAEFLRQQVASSGGRITEVFVTDALGLNVASSDITSDYWQGDEAKFTETHGRGPDAVHFSEIEFDESTQRYQAQISLTISDPATGRPIGAMTVGVDADSLM